MRLPELVGRKFVAQAGLVLHNLRPPNDKDADRRRRIATKASQTTKVGPR
jgi:hypothetical protein